MPDDDPSSAFRPARGHGRSRPAGESIQLPEARAITGAEPAEAEAGDGATSSVEKWFLIAAAVMLMLIVAAALILPHTPMASDW